MTLNDNTYNSQKQNKTNIFILYYIIIACLPCITFCVELLKIIELDLLRLHRARL